MPLSRPTLVLLGAMLALGLGRATGLWDLSGPLLLVPDSVWHGQLWRPFTAALLGQGLLDLVFNALALIWVAGAVERHWTPREWPLYAALCVGLGGLVACAFFPREPAILIGPAALIGALLVARVRLAPAERIQLSDTFSLPAFAPLLIWAGCLALAVLGGGFPLPGVVALVATAATGWVYLSLRWRFLHARPAQAAPRHRFDRLEL